MWSRLSNEQKHRRKAIDLYGVDLLSNHEQSENLYRTVSSPVWSDHIQIG